MMHERGQDLLQLKEQPFAGSVLIGVHVEGDPLQTSPRGGFLFCAIKLSPSGELEGG